MYKVTPVNENYKHMLHGADYNPDQWLDTPEVIDEDMRLFKLANCNEMSVGIFSWATLEPEEGKYDFSFLDDVLDKVAAAGGKIILATPSGARPKWMSDKYKEVLRVASDGTRNFFGFRHNHCYTSPVYREKITKINRLLAERYKNHPALYAWHISNEFGGECYCDLCRDAFKNWLKEKYSNDINKLNFQWWTKFWSHTYSSFEQIEFPSSKGETQVHGLNLDFKRFVTHQTTDFIKAECAPLREITPNIPITTNLMWPFFDLNYNELKKSLDFISFDNYPMWHAPQGDIHEASFTALAHDLYRSLMHKPFLMMESTPSLVNWKPINKLKKPGVNILSSLQAIAHGSDSVQYFQWRKSRGSSEKLHGAVVDHCGHENTRVFKEVSELGAILKKLDDVVGSYTKTDVAIIFDYENLWALNDAQGYNRNDKKLIDTLHKFYKPFWKRGINTEIISYEDDFSKYSLIVAPMLYMVNDTLIEKFDEYVKSGGTLVATYMLGLVNENDLCYLGGWPGGKLKDIFGIWNEEVDSLYPNEHNGIRTNDGKEYKVIDYCELIHANTAKVLATYTDDFYKGMPTVCLNHYGKGKAYYIACRDTGDFTDDFLGKLIAQNNIAKSIDIDLPNGVTAQSRENGKNKFIFLQNYNDFDVQLTLDNQYFEIISDQTLSDQITIKAYSVLILKTNCNR